MEEEIQRFQDIFKIAYLETGYDGVFLESGKNYSIQLLYFIDKLEKITNMKCKEIVEWFDENSYTNMKSRRFVFRDGKEKESQVKIDDYYQCIRMNDGGFTDETEKINDEVHFYKEEINECSKICAERFFDDDIKLKNCFSKCINKFLPKIHERVLKLNSALDSAFAIVNKVKI